VCIPVHGRCGVMPSPLVLLSVWRSDSGMAPTFNFTHCQLSRVATIAASTNQYSVPAVLPHAKDEEITQAPTMRTARPLDIAQNRHSFNILIPFDILEHH